MQWNQNNDNNLVLGFYLFEQSIPNAPSLINWSKIEPLLLWLNIYKRKMEFNDDDELENEFKAIGIEVVELLQQMETEELNESNRMNDMNAGEYFWMKYKQI